MSILMSALTEVQIETAEEEVGTRFVESFRTFLLNDKITLMNDDGPELQIMSRDRFDRLYVIDQEIFNGIFSVNHR